MKEELISKLKELGAEHSSIYKTLIENASNIGEIEKSLKMQMGIISIKVNYLEAQIFTYCEILHNYMGVNIESEVSSEVYSIYYSIKNHVAQSLNIKTETLPIDTRIEESLKKFKDGFKKE